MESDLKSLRIDRTSRRTKDASPRPKWMVIALIALVVAGLGAFAYSKLNAAVPVETIRVKAASSGGAAASEQVILSATGYIIAAHKIQVASKVVGRVASIGVEKGDRVKAGQILVRLEDDEYRASLMQQRGLLQNLEAKMSELQNGSRPEEIYRAKADVASAKADLANAKLVLDRNKQLSQDGVVAKQTLDDAQAKYDANEAKMASLQRTVELAVLGPRKEMIEQQRGLIEQAKGSLAYAQTQVDNTIIRAPVTGTILDRNVEKGEFVTTGFVGDKGAKGYLVTMADLRDLKVELDISQNDFPKLGPRQKGVLTTDAYPDRKYQGAIDEVSPEANRSKATVQVKVKVLNPDDFLRPDMNATVGFYNDVKQSENRDKNTVVIPPGAVQDGAVFLALDGHAKKRLVKVGGTTAQGVIVQSGLIGGEDLIVNPPAQLKDGQRLEMKK